MSSLYLLFWGQGVLCRPVVVLMEKLPSFWPMNKKIEYRATTAAEGEEDSWNGKAREETPKFYLVVNSCKAPLFRFSTSL